MNMSRFIKRSLINNDGFLKKSNFCVALHPLPVKFLQSHNGLMVKSYFLPLDDKHAKYLFNRVNHCSVL